MATVLVPLANGCEELEAVTIIDILRRAEFSVVTAGLTAGPIKGAHGITLVPDTTLGEAIDQTFDMIVLPGGLPGSDHLNSDLRIREIVKKMSDSKRTIAAICAAPKVFASMGLLIGRKVTAYPGVLENMNVPGIRLTGAPVTVDGRIITSRGPGTAMDFALALVEELAGIEKRTAVEQALKRPTLEEIQAAQPPAPENAA
ncbi:MAG: DJ-1 family glyoxalase III [Gammaproteobacteria bacterium]